jgi:hypothetical protein
MPVPHVVLVLLTSLVTIGATPHASAATRQPAHTKAQAEVNVLRVVAQTWKRRRIPDLIDPRTHLLANNTQATCSGRGKRYTGRRYARFICVIRPQMHRPHQGLYVSYRALRNGRFRIYWLVYRR